MFRGWFALSLSSTEGPVYSMMSFGPLYNYIIASHKYNENNKTNYTKHELNDNKTITEPTLVIDSDVKQNKNIH